MKHYGQGPERKKKMLLCVKIGFAVCSGVAASAATMRILGNSPDPWWAAFDIGATIIAGILAIIIPTKS